MSRRHYVSRRGLPELAEQLTAADWSILHNVQTVRLVSATQLQRLDHITGLSAVRSFRRRLARLSDLEALTRLDRTVGGFQGGSAAYVYRLGHVGQRLLNPGISTARRPWTPRPSWLAHALRVSELYVKLREEQDAGALKLVEFQSEPLCWRIFPGGYGEQIALKPDAYLHLMTESWDIFAFIEVDQGTESPATLSKKFQVYWQYWRSGHRLDPEVFPRVLWLVPDQRRQQVLVDVASRQDPERWQLHQVTKFDQAINVLKQPP